MKKLFLVVLLLVPLHAKGADYLMIGVLISKPYSDFGIIVNEDTKIPTSLKERGGCHSGYLWDF